MKSVALKRSDRLQTQILVITWVTVCTLFSLIPLVITILNAFKGHLEIESNIFAFPKFATIGENLSSNFSVAWGKMNHAMGRSLMLTIIGAIIDCILGSVLAYIFTYKQFHFKETIFFMYISVMLLPSIMGMPILVPFMRNVNLHNTYVGYLLPVIAGGQVGGLFLFRTFFGQQPRSIYESAQIEGASDVDIYFRLTIPLALPIILYKMVGTFSSLYNDYLWPQLIFKIDKRTLMPTMLDLQKGFVGGTGTGQKGAMYAMYVISSVPLIFTSAISMKFFSSGDFAAGIKL
jgi:ABC-type glycerol-3-phosphate transport system permease component